MAFIRRKKINGHYYYQAVRNYRDGEGRHRQELLCHLSKNETLDATIAAERAKLDTARETELSQKQRQKELYYEVMQDYEWSIINEWDGVIPDPCDPEYFDPYYLIDLRSEWQTYEPYRHGNHEYREHAIYFEALDMELSFLDLCDAYHRASDSAREARLAVATHEKRLERLLQVQRQYFGG